MQPFQESNECRFIDQHIEGPLVITLTSAFYTAASGLLPASMIN